MPTLCRLATVTITALKICLYIAVFSVDSSLSFLISNGLILIMEPYISSLSVILPWLIRSHIILLTPIILISIALILTISFLRTRRYFTLPISFSLLLI